MQLRELFQFHYGTIKSYRHLYIFHHIVKFQFHYGTIKRRQADTRHGRRVGFNSTMVRLKDALHVYAVVLV